MNTINWGGGAYSHNVEFGLKFRIGGQDDFVMRHVLIPIHTGDRGKDVAKSLVETWNVTHGGVPFAFHVNGAVFFMCQIALVTLRSGSQSVQLPDNGTAVMVPGNDGLVAWCE